MDPTCWDGAATATEVVVGVVVAAAVVEVGVDVAGAVVVVVAGLAGVTSPVVAAGIPPKERSATFLSASKVCTTLMAFPCRTRSFTEKMSYTHSTHHSTDEKRRKREPGQSMAHTCITHTPRQLHKEKRKERKKRKEKKRKKK